MGIPTVTGIESASPVAIARPDGGGPVAIPDAELMFKGDYSRQGSDLLLTGKDGASILIPDYFSGEGPVALVSPAGALLKPEVVEALAGPLAPGQYAQAGGAPVAGEAIGQVETINGTCTATRADGSVVQLAVGQPVYQGDVLQTGADSALGVTFADGTVFAMTAEARMVLNNFVFQPQGQNNSMLFNLVEGGFTFLAGQIAPTGDMKVGTPVATMGIRGTTPVVTILDNGNVLFSIREDPNSDRVGVYQLINANGEVIATVTNTGTNWLMTSPDSTPQEIAKSNVDIANDEAAGQVLLGAFNSAVGRGFQVGPGGGGPPENGPQNQQPGDDEEANLDQDAIQILGLGTSELAQLVYDVLNPATDLGLAVDRLLGNLETETNPLALLGDSLNNTPGGSGVELTLPGTLPAMIEDTPTVLTGFLVTGSGIITVTITAQSTITLDNSEGAVDRLVFTVGDGTDDETMVFSGTAEDITLALNGLIYNPTPNNDVTGGITFQVTNPFGADDGTLGFDLEGVNDPPVVVPVSGSAAEDAPFSANLLEGSSDPDTGAILVVTNPAQSITTGDERVLQLGVHYTITGSTFALTPEGVALFDSLAQGETDTFAFTYQVSDGQVPVENTLTVTITGSNDAPVISAPNGGEPAIIEVGENSTAVTTVVAADPDNGAVLTYSIIGGDDAGLFTINAQTGELSFIDAPDFEGEGDNSYTVEVQVSDGLGGLDTQTITVDVANVNESPTASPISDTVDEDGPTFSQDLLATASDPDAGTVLQVAGIPSTIITTGGRELVLGTHYTVVGATFALTAAGFLLFNSLPAGAEDSFTLDYQVSDGALSTPNSLDVTVTGTNDAPQVTAFTGSVGEDGPTFTQNLLTGATDPDTGAILSVTGVPVSVTTEDGRVLELGEHYSVEGGVFSLTQAGFAVFNSLGEGESDTLVLNYGVTDGTATTPNSLTLTVNGDNDAPQVTAIIETTTEGDPFSTSLIQGVTDPDGGPLTVDGDATIVTSGNVTLTEGTDYEIDGTDFVLTETGLAKFEGLAVGESDSFTFDFQVSDGVVSVPNTLTVTISGENDAPQIVSGTFSGSIDEAEGGEGGPEPLTPIAEGYLTHGNTLVNGLGGDYGFGEGMLIPNDDGSSDAIDITSVFGVDGLNFFGSMYTSIYINNNGNVTFEGPLSTFTPTEITAGIGSPIIAAFWGDVDTRGADLVEPSPGGTSQGTNDVYYDIDSTNGVFTITWDDVGYFASHTDLVNAFQMQLISTGNGNFDIVFRYEAINWTTGDASGGTGGLGGIPARAGYSAGDGENYFEIAGSGDQGSMLALPTVVGNTGVAGLFVFHVVGGEVVGVDLTTSGTIQFTDADRSDTHDASTAFVSATGPGGEQPLGELVAEVTTDSTNGATGTVTWTYTVDSEALDFLDTGETRIETFNVTIDDGNGGTITQVVTVTLNGVNDAPLLDLSAGLAGSGFSTNFDPFESPPVGITGKDVSITDVDDTTITSATVTLTNASDGDELFVDGNALANLGLQATTQEIDDTIVVTITGIGNAAVSHDTYEQALELITYDNTSGEPSTADRLIRITVNDGEGNSNTATSVIRYGEGDGGNESPVAYDDSFETGENSPLNGNLLVANGENGYGDPDFDPDGDALLITGASQGDGSSTVSIELGSVTVLSDGGTIEINSDGTFTFDPGTDFDYLGVNDTATVDFEYTISDGKGGEDAATVTITVEGENDDPDAQDDTFEVFANSSLGSSSVIGDNGYGVDDDIDQNDSFTVTFVNGNTAVDGNAITLSSGAELRMFSDGTFNYDPNGAFDHLGNGQSTTDTFSYTVEDENGGTDTATVTINVTGVNDAPTLDLSGSGDETNDYATNYSSEGSAIAVVSEDVEIADIDDGAEIFSATVTVTNGVEDADFLLIADGGSSMPSGITYDVSDDGLSITLTSEDGASHEDFETALQQVRYEHSSQEVNPADRTIEIVVNDGLANSNTATTTITIDNEAPQFQAALPDVAFSEANLLYIANNVGGTFATPVAASTWDPNLGTYGMAVGDLDGDLRPDILIAERVGEFGDSIGRVLINLLDGSFASSPPTYGGEYYSEAEIADIDRDAIPEVVLVNQNWGSIDIFKLDDPDEPFESLNGYSAAFGDFNHDGYLDVFAVGVYFTDDAYLNDGTGHFESTDNSAWSDTSSSDARVGDIDNDGDLDVVAIGHDDDAESDILVVYTNDGLGGFTQSVLASPDEGGYSIALGHLDSDGFIDAVVSFDNDGTGGQRIYRGSETGFIPDGNAFTDTIGQTIISDVDGDGQLDIIVANSDSNNGFAFEVYLNDGGNFAAEPSQVVSFDNVAAPAIATIDVDGYAAGIPEDFSGDVVARVQAVDPNDGDTITYSIVGDAVIPFEINSETGEISLISGQQLDYETQSSYDLTVRATDNHGAYSETDVTLHITDVDDEDSIVGTDNDDVLRGGFFNDTLSGLDGQDYLHGGEGDDDLNGGDGFDFISYEPDYTSLGIEGEPVGAGINANLVTGEVTDVFGDTDTLTSIEGVIGSLFDDFIIGDGGNNIIWSSDGSDTLTGGGGDDIFGFDWDDNGIDTVTDYDYDVVEEEGDLLDLSALLYGSFEDIDLNPDNYVQLNELGELSVSWNGDGSNYVQVATLEFAGAPAASVGFIYGHDDGTALIAHVTVPTA